MNCLKCECHNAPVEVKQVKCIKCSMHEYSAHRYNCNELSNAGQTIESLDNHNPDYADDRDIVSQVKREFRDSIQDASRANADPARHPSKAFSVTAGVSVSDAAYDRLIDFIYALTSLNEMALCLFFSTIKREEKSTFANRHGISPTKVNKLYWDLIASNPSLSNFIILTNGTLEGTRGRKPGQRNRRLMSTDCDNRGQGNTSSASVLPRSIADSRMGANGVILQQLSLF